MRSGLAENRHINRAGPLTVGPITGLAVYCVDREGITIIQGYIANLLTDLLISNSSTPIFVVVRIWTMVARRADFSQ